MQGRDTWGCQVPLQVLAGDSSGPRAEGGLWSQVLQGFLSLLRVTVVTVGVGPLAKGLLDVHVPLRVGQTLLVSGEEAKPFWKRKKEMRAGPLLCTVEFLPCQDIQQQMWKEANQFKV